MAVLRLPLGAATDGCWRRASTLRTMLGLRTSEAALEVIKAQASWAIAIVADDDKTPIHRRIQVIVDQQRPRPL